MKQFQVSFCLIVDESRVRHPDQVTAENVKEFVNGMLQSLWITREEKAKDVKVEDISPVSVQDETDCC